jgi:hypothetical protein
MSLDVIAASVLGGDSKKPLRQVSADMLDDIIITVSERLRAVMAHFCQSDGPPLKVEVQFLHLHSLTVSAAAIESIGSTPTTKRRRSQPAPAQREQRKLRLVEESKGHSAFVTMISFPIIPVSIQASHMRARARS